MSDSHEEDQDLPCEMRSVGDFWVRLPPQSVKNMGDERLNSNTPIWAEGVSPLQVARSIYDSPKKVVRYGGCITVVVVSDERERFNQAVRSLQEIERALRREA